MCKDAMWKAFAETGEPVFYLLYKAMDTQTEKTETRGFAAG